jgi:hypothetical protein
MMVISEIEVVGLLQFAVRQVAEKLGIADVAWKGVTELLEEIGERDRTTCNELKAFLNSYIDWFHFHKQIDRLGKQGKLDSSEQAELARLVARRNETRAAILRRLASLS